MYSKSSKKFLLSVAPIALAMSWSTGALAHDFDGGAVYTISNAVAGNAVLVYHRHADGSLSPAQSLPTGGTGTGQGLGSQGAVALDGSAHWLFAVNAGSNDVSTFVVDDGGARLTSRESSGGVMPTSVAEHEGLVYVLNAGSGTLNGFWLGREGRLHPIPDSTRSLGANVGAAEVKFSRDGNALVVTEKGSGNIVSYQVNADGLLTHPEMIASPTPTPFGFDFGRHDRFFVSEANGGMPNASSVSSYDLSADVPAILSRSVPTHQTAACWVIATRDGKFVYTTDAGSGVISAYSVAHDGHLTLLSANGINGSTGAGSHPSDMALSHDGKYLYSLNNGNGSISAFRVEPNGTLSAVNNLSGIPLSANGLAAR